METNPMRFNLIASLLEFLETQKRIWLWVEAVLLAGFIGYIDYITGYEVSVVLFYSLPILLIVWYTDRISGVLMAVLCALIWWWADVASGHQYHSSLLQIWDTVVCLAYFLCFVMVGTAAKARIALLEHSRQLEQEIIRISEREQRRIGHDLHDGLCQYYAAVGCAAGSLKHTLEKLGSPAVKSAAEIENLIMKGVGQARDLARGLSPVGTDERALQFALEELALTASRLLGIDCQVFYDESVISFDSVGSNHVYRIVQEAVNNAHRHGKATQVRIRLDNIGTESVLTIEDNGVGIPQPLPESGGMGLSVMQYRARMVGGQWKIAARPEGGTIVTCSFSQVIRQPHPLHDDNHH